MVWPVIQAPAGEQSRSRVPTSSSGAPCARVQQLIARNCANGDPGGTSSVPASLVTLPGAIALTLLLERPSCLASVVVSLTSASLLTPQSETAGKAPPDTWLTMRPPPRSP